MGAATVHYVPQQPDNVDEQRALIDEALAARPAAFVFVPVHGTRMDAAVRKIRTAGVPLFNLINRLRNADDYITFVGADDRQLASHTGVFLYETMGGHGNVVILEGTPGTISCTPWDRSIEERECPACDSVSALGRSLKQL